MAYPKETQITDTSPWLLLFVLYSFDEGEGPFSYIFPETKQTESNKKGNLQNKKVEKPKKPNLNSGGSTNQPKSAISEEN